MTTATTPHHSKTRSPRFASAAPRTNIELTPRDLEIFGHLAQHRFLRANDLALLMLPDAALCVDCGGRGVIENTATLASSPHNPCRGTGRQGHRTLIDRLGVLFRGGYLSRPPAQLGYYQQGFNRRIVYALANDGARALVRHGTLEQQDRIDWSERNQSATRHFILHTLDVASFAVAAILSARRHTSIDLLFGKRLIETLPATTQTAPFPFKLMVTLTQDGKRVPFGVIPDWALAMHVPSASGRRVKVLPTLVEIDRGTMPIKRSTLAQTSLMKKCQTYETARRIDLHSEQLDWDAFRVALVTTTDARADAIVEAIKRDPQLAGSPLFVVSTLDRIKAAPDLLTMPWATASGETFTLLPPRAITS